MVAEAGLSAVETWVFDLDNTLYPATCNLFPQIDVRMRRFIADRLGLGLDEAFALQKRYYREFGTTLRGLMLVHGLEPSEYLAYVHDIDHSVLEPCPRLQAALARLPGRKLIFTNGSERHAEAVLDRLGLARQFAAIFDVAAAGYVPKPQPETYALLCDRHAVDPRRAAMIEDLQRNLEPAFRLGMKTVWVRHSDHPDAAHAALEDGDLSHVDYITDDLAGWLATAV